MKIDYVMTVKAKIVFDGVLENNDLADDYFNLECLVGVAQNYINTYHFDEATIEDKETGEILVIIHSDDYDDDDEEDYEEDYEEEEEIC